MTLKSLIAGGVGVLMLVLLPGLSWSQISEERLRRLEQEVETLKKEQAEAAKRPAKFPIDIGASVTIRYDLTEVEDQIDVRLDEDRDGFRTRTRLGAEFVPDGPVNAGVRLTTGANPNPTSPFIRFGDVFRSKAFNIDQFWLAVRPIKFFDERPMEQQFADVAVIAGRMPQPFWRGGRGTWNSELIWDDDISPEGFGAKLTIPHLGVPGLQLQAASGYFVIQELDDFRFVGLTGDTYLVAGQVKVEYKPVALAVALYSFNRLNAGLRAPTFTPGVGAVLGPGTSAILLRDPALQRSNNQLDFGPGAVGFVDDRFDILNVTGQFYYPLPVIPQIAPEVFLVGDFARNLSVGRDRNGYGITAGFRGGKVGSGINPFNLWFTYRDVDADATLATFADSDLGNGTSYRGIEVGVNYRLHRNLLVQISGFAFDAGPNKDIYWRRVFFDVVANF